MFRNLLSKEFREISSNFSELSENAIPFGCDTITLPLRQMCGYPNVGSSNESKEVTSQPAAVITHLKCRQEKHNVYLGLSHYDEKKYSFLKLMTYRDKKSTRIEELTEGLEIRALCFMLKLCLRKIYIVLIKSFFELQDVRK